MRYQQVPPFPDTHRICTSCCKRMPVQEYNLSARCIERISSYEGSGNGAWDGKRCMYLLKCNVSLEFSKVIAEEAEV